MKKVFAFALALLIWSCSDKETVDLIVLSGHIQTVDPSFNTCEAMAIKGGKVVDTGSNASILAAYQTPQVTDLEGAYVYPAFNDAHCHFLGYARGLLRVDLVGTTSFEEVVDRVRTYQEEHQVAYIEGRGWDQNDWAESDFPDREALDALFPETPVKLKRIDGHAALVNQAALDYAKIDQRTEVSGGLIEEIDGRLTGMLIDNAVDLVEFPEDLDQPALKQAIAKAQKNLFQKGITSVTIAGLNKDEILYLQNLQEEGLLKLRINAMVKDDSASLYYFLQADPIANERLRVKSAKFYLDGALGSRGALLLAPYSDDPDQYGLRLTEPEHMRYWAEKLSAANWQMCAHAIGDSANRWAVDLYQEALNGKKDHRWRIEHAQIVEASDLRRMTQFNIIPSVQPTHATSDMYWADLRLGNDRMQRAYPAADFIQMGSILPLGTDFPVENIDPMRTLRAAVFRTDADGRYFERPGADQRISFRTALRGMTYWPAKAAFEENFKGGLYPGMVADFTIFPHDLSKMDWSELEGTEPSATFLNGEAVTGKP